MVTLISMRRLGSVLAGWTLLSVLGTATITAQDPLRAASPRRSYIASARRIAWR